jgi:hypothetical protein
LQSSGEQSSQRIKSMESAASTLLKELDNKEVIISGSVENE